MITGGTSGIGSELARELSIRGAQLVLLTQHPLSDPFLVEYVEELRASTSNELITAEQGEIQTTEDGVEVNWALNYLANFHLLSILSPAIRAQPPDRDVRVLFGSCISYLGGELPVQAQELSKEGKDPKSKKAQSTTAAPQPTSNFVPSAAYATSKLALATFAHAFQKHLSSYQRPDKFPPNAHVILVDPGFTRTPGMRRYLSWGSLYGLFFYLIMYPFWWLVLKSPEQGAQSFLYAAMEATYGKGEGGWLIRECREAKIARPEIRDEAVQKALWEYSEKMVQEAEKRGAQTRAKAKKEAEEKAQAKPKQEAQKQSGSRRSRKVT
ncbi:hypothetical protein H2203_003289 [Taxawa tesnikishii (nom. ined.)]|nr:hypothetical protein H2203_003289 [Dothideales sp. JES 119]